MAAVDPKQNTIEQKVGNAIDNYAAKSKLNRVLTVIGCAIVGAFLLLAGMPDKAEQSFEKAKEASTISIINSPLPQVVTPTAIINPAGEK